MRQNKQNLLEEFPLVNLDKITVIPSADLTAFIPIYINSRPKDIPINAKVVLFFGIIEPRKGVLPLIRAFADVYNQVPEAYLLIVGKAFENVNPYLKEIRRLGLGDRLQFRNEYIPLEEIPSLFAYSDVFVAPYLSGWNSGAIATAHAHGKPVIATNTGGIFEVVEDGHSGFLVPPGDENTLAEAITRILKDDTLRRRMSETARIKGETNSWYEIARKTEEVYQAVNSSL